jgi:IS5 family transposase
VATTPANTADVTQAHRLLHGEETDVFGDAGYQGVEKREENQKTDVNWHTALRPGKRKALPTDPAGRLREHREQAKASIRAIVEHPFHAVKNLLGHRKARYRGLAKNEVSCLRSLGWPICFA